MADRRSVKSRKQANVSKSEMREDKESAKSSLVNKVNARNTSSRPSDSAKSMLGSKVNNQELSQRYKRVEPTKLTSNTDNGKKAESKKTAPAKKKEKKPGKKNFFTKLSVIGKVMFTIYVVLFVTFALLLGSALLKKGDVVLGNRQKPGKVITDAQVKEVKGAIENKVKADSISVSYNAYRFVVVMDLADNTNASDGRQANIDAYNTIKTILPIDEYFGSKDKLNNDLFIYSTDVVPSDLETNSKYIYQSYKNSKMSKPKNYDLLKYRDKKSYEEVVKSMQEAKKDGN